mmetsp:Transcript_12440/g.17368  ORF Transcript_12440/g.17368 Transcript_12440/m.17368 type:complete len:180 (-) Transcript_12440:190-729(-)
MTRLTISALLLLSSILSLGNAFTATVSSSRPAFGVAGPLKMAFGKDSDSGGGAALAKPKVNIGQKTALVTETKQKVSYKKKNKPAEPVQRREEDFQEAPMYKVMLIEDDGYDVAHVVERMCAIMEDMDEDQAANVFQQAQQEGKAMCGKYPMEIAELYKEQLLRSNPMIFSDIMEENEN